MNELILSDEEIHGKEPTWEEKEIEKLKKKIELLEEKLEDTLCKITVAKTKLELDVKVNDRCLKEYTGKDIKRLLELSIQFDKELLEILSDEE